MTIHRALPLLALLAVGCTGDNKPSTGGAFDGVGFAQLRDFSAHRVSSDNADTSSNDDSKRPIPGETITLADLKGPGVVSHIWLTIAGNEYGWPRLLRLRVYYDGSDVPSVDAPVGDFFGVGHGLERPVNSLMVRNSSSGRSRNEYWPMPFRKSVKITLTNEGTRRFYNVYYHVDWQKHESLPRNTAYFHARYRQALPPKNGDWYDFLRVNGRGFYVGSVLNVVQVEAGWFGEGDDLFYVDGNPKPVITGTGTEDYFNDAWSFRIGEGPYAGVPVADGTETGARMGAYRWHLYDPIPFTKSLRASIEHNGWTFDKDGAVRSASEDRPDLFSSVAYWYQMGIANDQPEPPYGAARLPQGNATQIEIEKYIKDSKATGGTDTVLKEVFWGKDILFFRAKGPGSRLDVPLDVPADGRYEVLAQVAEAPDYGTYSVLIDGKVPNASGQVEHEPGANVGNAASIDGYYSELFVGEDRVIAWPDLTKGRHIVSFICTGKNGLATGYNLGLDGLVLSHIAGSPGVVTKDSATMSDPADAMRRLGSKGDGAAAYMDSVAKALKSPNADVRIAAAWTLTQMGASASTSSASWGLSMADPDPIVRGLIAIALRYSTPLPTAIGDTLIAHLKDPDENVRMVVANALAAHPDVAKKGLNELIAAAMVPWQHRHVLRSIADALGAIGPDAKPALPALEQMMKQPLVRWQASAAIRAIGGGKN